MKYIIEIEALRIVQEKEEEYYGYATTKLVDVPKEISEQEIYEAVAKYCMVKGFSTSVLSVKNTERDVDVVGDGDG